MFKTVLATAAVLATTAGAALATPGWEIYHGGDASRGNLYTVVGTKPGVLVYVHAGQAFVRAFVIPDRCSNGKTGAAAFDGLPGANRKWPLAGAIGPNGRFSAVDHADAGGLATAVGSLSGAHGTITIRVRASRAPHSSLRCSGSHRFSLTRGSPTVAR